MDAGAVMAVGGVVGAIARILYARGLSGSLATVATFILSAVFIVLWGYSHEPVYSRALVWPYVEGWAAVLVVAAGAFHIIEEAPKTSAFKSMTGTNGR